MTVPTPQDVLSAVKQPVPKIADMRHMKIFEVRLSGLPMPEPFLQSL